MSASSEDTLDTVVTCLELYNMSNPELGTAHMITPGSRTPSLQRKYEDEPRT